MKTQVNEGEIWIVQIDDKVELHRMLVVKAYRRCYELQEFVDGMARGPKKLVKRQDIEFVEKM